MSDQSSPPPDDETFGVEAEDDDGPSITDEANVDPAPDPSNTGPTQAQVNQEAAPPD